MHSLFRTALLLLLAMVGVGVLLATLILLTTELTVVSASPAEFLPRKETVLYIPEIHEGIEEDYGTILEAQGIAEYDKEGTVAVLQNEEGIPSTVHFQKRTAHTDSADMQTFGGYTVSVSTPLPSSLIGESDDRLGEYQGFHTLMSNTQSDLWIKRGVLFADTSLKDALLSAVFLGNATEAALSQEPSRLRIHTYDRSAVSPLIQGTLTVVEEPTVVVSTGNMRESLEELFDALPQKYRDMLVSILHTRTINKLGHAVSMEFDLLPLLEGNGVLSIYHNNEDWNVLMTGRASTKRIVTKALDRFHASYRTTLPQSTSTNRVLDRRFSAKDVRHDPLRIQEHIERVEGWNLRETKGQGRSSSLVTAYKGNRFALATKRELLEKALLQSGALITFPTSASLHQPQRTAGGYVNLATFRDFVNAILPGTVQEVPLWNTNTGTLLWAVERQNAIRTLTIQETPNATSE